MSATRAGPGSLCTQPLTADGHASLDQWRPHWGRRSHGGVRCGEFPAGAEPLGRDAQLAAEDVVSAHWKAERHAKADLPQRLVIDLGPTQADVEGDVVADLPDCTDQCRRRRDADEIPLVED